MDDQIEQYLNNVKINPKRYSFRQFFDYCNEIKKAHRTICQIRFLYMVQKVGQRLYGSLAQRIKNNIKKTIKYIRPLPRIKFEHKDIKNLFDKFKPK